MVYVIFYIASMVLGSVVFWSMRVLSYFSCSFFLNGLCYLLHGKHGCRVCGVLVIVRVILFFFFFFPELLMLITAYTGFYLIVNCAIMSTLHQFWFFLHGMFTGVHSQIGFWSLIIWCSSSVADETFCSLLFLNQQLLCLIQFIDLGWVFSLYFVNTDAVVTIFLMGKMFCDM